MMGHLIGIDPKDVFGQKQILNRHEKLSVDPEELTDIKCGEEVVKRCQPTYLLIEARRETQRLKARDRRTIRRLLQARKSLDLTAI
jgi:hypothetical protein